ncbi:TIGR02584 family CRISPR-associated protein [Pseudoalteromonas sp. SG43-7]|uniref:CRISPR-associated ring nuclease Csm6 n=1 Tax=Pseudoalteromonas sp. SG43-7 TaxID=2760966 RepID=UPI0016011E44|nr:CRISPR-associated ring nuclease Csm6 [Pseudoalteromonas sp. SG43-7]MBB1420784.1 TIGR02584 family CRISPR-associated protein [Pseudoalteromonas sp. SG43-7]
MSTKQHVLLAVSGMTPQIITETLYGIYRQDPTKVPQRIEVITTQDGRERLINNLLGKNSPLKQLINDYQLPNITFTPEDIKVPEGDDSQPLNDIKSEREQEIITDFITDHVRKLSQDPNIIIHASLAGGRKTMGFALGYAMSLFGRPQDTLSHVLVSEPYETIPDFYYPTPNTVMRADRDKKSQHDLSQAHVMLAKIPLVLMREEMPTSLMNEPSVSYTNTVARINRANSLSTESATVELDFTTMSICCDGITIALKADCFAFYSWLAQDSKKYPGEGIEPPKREMKMDELDERFSDYLKATLPPEVTMNNSWTLDELFEQANDAVYKMIEHEQQQQTAYTKISTRNNWLLKSNEKTECLYSNTQPDRDQQDLFKIHKNLWDRLLKETNQAIKDDLGPRLAEYYQIVTVSTAKDEDNGRTRFEYKGLKLAAENIHLKL